MKRAWKGSLLVRLSRRISFKIAPESISSLGFSISSFAFSAFFCLA